MLGKLAFIGVAQSAGFKLSEIKELVHSVDAAGWHGRPDALAVEPRATNCGCQTPDECALFAASGDDRADADLGLTVIQVKGGDCRRATT